ncbi:hypothetical protein C7377_0886 [Balneicella halophila]|uniref:Uncharacterized protein n=1 Tax=Balneicella halophila TaxID=1537566 RepID=A0A7L4USB3_BALHA|nr:hypothetical protein [Balneicella halophila]PVX52559.1 hypothetical protein C7377_0886 [Balneicella halophila]
MSLVYFISHRFASYSKKGYGIHSPFVYQFQKQILRPKGREKKIYGDENDKVLRMMLRMKHHYKLTDILLLNNNYYNSFDKYHLKYDKTPVLDKKYNLVILGKKDCFGKLSLSNEAFVISIGTRFINSDYSLREKCDFFLDLYKVRVFVFNNGFSHQEFKLVL